MIYESVCTSVKPYLLSAPFLSLHMSQDICSVGLLQTMYPSVTWTGTWGVSFGGTAGEETWKHSKTQYLHPSTQTCASPSHVLNVGLQWTCHCLFGYVSTSVCAFSTYAAWDKSRGKQASICEAKETVLSFSVEADTFSLQPSPFFKKENLWNLFSSQA